MPGAGASVFSEFLNYGGLGLLGLLCLVVLGHNAWSLNALVKKAEPRRITAARPLLLAQMGLSLVGLFGVGLGAVYLGQLELEDNRVRTTVVTLDPWDDQVEERYRPRIELPEGTALSRPLSITCAPGHRPAMVRVNFAPYIQHMVETGLKRRETLPLPTLSGG